MKKLSDIFDSWYGVNLELINCDIIESGGIPFIARTSGNNGMVARVAKIDNIKPNPPHTLSLACGGSVLSCFYQDEEYYSGRDLFILSPKEKMTKAEMLLYSYIIGENAYKYNYGRQANKTYKNILLPELSEINNINWQNINTDYKFNSNRGKSLSLNIINWKEFEYKNIFVICKGFYNKKPESSTSEDYPFIGASDSNNGVTANYSYEDIEESSKTGEEPNADISEKIFKGNCITVSNNGSVGYAFYQAKDFTCSHDVNPLYIHPKWEKELNPYLAMFICSVIMLDRYRWGYGRKWRPKRMPTSKIKLPVDANGNPDWQFMEDYIKSLPYSANL